MSAIEEMTAMAKKREKNNK